MYNTDILFYTFQAYIDTIYNLYVIMPYIIILTMSLSDPHHCDSEGE